MSQVQEKVQDMDQEQGKVAEKSASEEQNEVVLVPVSIKIDEIKSPYIRFLNQYPKTILLISLLAAVGIAIYGVGVFAVLKNGGFSNPNSESSKVVHYFDRFDNVSSSSDLVILLSHPTWVVDDDDYEDAYFELKANLLSEFPLSKIQSYFDYKNESAGYVSIDRHLALITAGLPDYVVDYENKPVFTADDFNAVAVGSPLTVTFGGSMLSNEEVLVIIPSSAWNS